MPLSPGVYVNEFDFSQYAPLLGITTLAVVGGATRGPLNTPTTVTSVADLTRKFGNPTTLDYGLLSAVQYLQRGSQLTYVRVADPATVATANYPVPGLSGGTPAVGATGYAAFTASTNPSDGDTITVSATIPKLTLQHDVMTASGNQAITKTGANIDVTGMTGGSASAFASGVIKLLNGAQPADANTIVLNDGTNPAVTFEFDSNSSVSQTATLRQVVIGANAYATLQNLVTAINAAPALAITATNATVQKVFEFDNNGSVTSGHVAVLIGATASATLLNLISAFSLQSATLNITGSNGTVTVPRINFVNNNTGTDGNGPILTTGSNITVSGFTGGTDAIAGSAMNTMGLYANSPGSWGNSVQVQVAATTIYGAPAGNFDLIVYAPVDTTGTLATVERFQNLSTDPTSTRFAETIVAYGKSGEVGPSEYITVDVLVNNSTVAAGTYVLGQAPGVAGADGISTLSAAHYIGTISGQNATGLQSLANPETTEFNVLAVPGVSHKDVINAALTLAAKRQDFVYLIDPPFGLSRDAVVSWHNGVGSVAANQPTSPITSNYAILYWSWVQTYDAYSKTNVWLPPSGFAAGAYAYMDDKVGPWRVPAGHTYGPVFGDKVEYSPSQEDRDVLEGGQNRVNPIVNFQQSGLTLYGNRTCQRVASALENIHTRRMLIYAEKLIATAVKYLVFEPNDPVTWKTFETLVNPVLANIKANRGLEEFKVICDASTNPPAQRQQKVMKGKILVSAIESAEIISLDFNLYATGADFAQAGN